MAGQIFTGGGGRIVGPEKDALQMREVLNDLDLRIAFQEGTDSVVIYARHSMAQLGVDFPVMVLPASKRQEWLNDPATPKHLLRLYDGEFPTESQRRSSFEIVTPRHG